MVRQIMGMERAVSYSQRIRSNEGWVFVVGKKLHCPRQWAWKRRDVQQLLQLKTFFIWCVCSNIKLLYSILCYGMHSSYPVINTSLTSLSSLLFKKRPI